MGFYRAIMSLECLSGVFVLVASNDTQESQRTNESCGNFKTSPNKFITWIEIKQT